LYDSRGLAGVERLPSDMRFIAPPLVRLSTDVEVHVFRQDDGATVVLIDTHGGGDDRLRIRVNDNPIFDQGVETRNRPPHPRLRPERNDLRPRSIRTRAPSSNAIRASVGGSADN
jgi:hypothetical protein